MSTDHLHEFNGEALRQLNGLTALFFAYVRSWRTGKPSSRLPVSRPCPESDVAVGVRDVTDLPRPKTGIRPAAVKAREPRCLHRPRPPPRLPDSRRRLGRR